MKSIKKTLLGICAASALALTCASCSSYRPIAAGSGTVGEKRGEASSVNVLGFQLKSDNTMLKAAQNGGIKHIATVDQQFFTFLGLYTTVTTIVTGD
ncbi:TRL domain-containing protein [Treponema zioleckii]|uniref:TRL domain-containing protein n=1 Tax=Treponema zioleckii TaxID=331680 RepID=UPI00168AA634|nr:TRL domain-containing protein [Treponema zioleckii]